MSEHDTESCALHGIHADGLEVSLDIEDQEYTITMVKRDEHGQMKPVASVRIPSDDAEAMSTALKVHIETPKQVLQ